VLKVSLVAAASWLIPLTSQAGLPYVVGGGAITQYQESGLNKFNSFALEGALGYRFNPYLAAEARLGLGFGDDSQNTSRVFSGDTTATSVKVTYEVNNYIQGMILPTLPVTDDFHLYAGIGLARAEFTGKASYSGTTNSADSSEMGLSWALGSSLKFNNKTSVRLEYSSVVSGSQDLASWGLKVGYAF